MKQYLLGAIATISLGLSAASLAQTTTDPVNTHRPVSQCAGLGGGQRDTCLQQQSTRPQGIGNDAGSRAVGGTPSRSGDAASRTGIAPGFGTTAALPVGGPRPQ